MYVLRYVLEDMNDRCLLLGATLISLNRRVKLLRTNFTYFSHFYTPFNRGVFVRAQQMDDEKTSSQRGGNC